MSRLAAGFKAASAIADFVIFPPARIRSPAGWGFQAGQTQIEGGRSRFPSGWRIPKFGAVTGSYHRHLNQNG